MIAPFTVIHILSVALFLICNIEAQPKVFDITKYGSTPTGDNAPALMKAWDEACKTGGTVTIPKGTFPLGVVRLAGPCKGPMTFNHKGTLLAPNMIHGQGWINFQHIDGLTVTGGGTFDGQGQALWKTNFCAKSVDTCQSQAISLRFDFVSNGKVTGITSRNAKMFHINVLGCNNLSFEKYKATAPRDSPTTDGIHIAKSKRITVIDSDIATGDDCVSIGDGSQNIIISNVKCGPGHGISIGSLGRYPDEEPVQGIIIKGCTLTNTDNGVRIKSWPAMTACEASDIHFEGLTMNNVSNPILIDQMYCPNNQCSKESPSKVKIRGVTFKDIKGTTATPIAINLACSPAFPCQNVQFSNVDVKYTGSEGPAKARCTNVKPIISGTINPKGC